MARPWKRLCHPLAVSLLIGVGVFAAVWTLRQYGKLEYLELKTYDAMLRLQPRDLRAANDIAIIGIDEPDIAAMGTVSIGDDQMAKLLQRLCDMGACAIGVDIYRDQPVMQGREELNKVLLAHSNIICVHLWKAVAPPEVLASKARRIGTADIHYDRDGTARKALLYLGGGEEGTAQSIAVGVANKCMETENAMPAPTVEDPAHLLTFWPLLLPMSRRNEGPYVNASNEGYQFLVDFRGPVRFAHYSLRQALPDLPHADRLPAEQQLPPLREADVKGKILLVGMTPPSVKDYVQTPLNSYAWGVDYHAATIDYLLRRVKFGAEPMRFWSVGRNAGWTLLWSLVGAGIGFVIRSSIRFSAVVLAAIGALAAIIWLAFVNQWWLPLLPPAACLLASAALTTSYMGQCEKRARGLMMQLFGCLVQKDVAVTLWEQREQILEEGRLQPREITATLLFTDLKGFTSCTEKLGSPRVLIDWLNEYMNAMTRVAEEHGGTVAKYIGDSLMVIFGAPLYHSTEEEFGQDATDAVECALAMRRKFGELNRKWVAEGKPTIRMRVGIYTGVVVVGSLGSESRQEYTTLGDTVNTASRLESYDKTLMDEDIAVEGCRILIGEPTYRYLNGHFRTRHIGSIQLTGKEQSVGVFGVISREATS